MLEFLDIIQNSLRFYIQKKYEMKNQPQSEDFITSLIKRIEYVVSSAIKQFTTLEVESMPIQNTILARKQRKEKNEI